MSCWHRSDLDIFGIHWSVSTIVGNLCWLSGWERLGTTVIYVVHCLTTLSSGATILNVCCAVVKMPELDFPTPLLFGCKLFAQLSDEVKQHILERGAWMATGILPSQWCLICDKHLQQVGEHVKGNRKAGAKHCKCLAETYSCPVNMKQLIMALIILQIKMNSGRFDWDSWKAEHASVLKYLERTKALWIKEPWTATIQKLQKLEVEAARNVTFRPEPHANPTAAKPAKLPKALVPVPVTTAATSSKTPTAAVTSSKSSTRGSVSVDPLVTSSKTPSAALPGKPPRPAKAVPGHALPAKKKLLVAEEAKAQATKEANAQAKEKALKLEAIVAKAKLAVTSPPKPPLPPPPVSVKRGGALPLPAVIKKRPPPPTPPPPPVHVEAEEEDEVAAADEEAEDEDEVAAEDPCEEEMAAEDDLPEEELANWGDEAAEE